MSPAADAGRVAPAEEVAFEAWGLLLRVHATVTSGLDAALQREAGVTLSTYDLLAHVASARDRRIRLHDLEQRVFFSQSTVSRLAARLEREGLLERSVPACDRRSVEVRLTAAGAATFRSARAVAAGHLRRAFVGRLAPGQDAPLRDALASVYDAGAHDHAQPPADG
jgi:DNA-binding MarR family transcriptional regulator